MTILILVILSILLIISFHEVGHIITALIFKYKKIELCFSWFPVPHPFVKAYENKNIKNGFIKQIFYYLSGTLTTIILFFIFIYFFNNVLYLKYAFFIVFLLETNPFYSDFVHIINLKKINIYKLDNANNKVNFIYNYYSNFYYFSFIWYIHLITWIFLFVYIYLTFKIK